MTEVRELAGHTQFLISQTMTAVSDACDEMIEAGFYIPAGYDMPLALRRIAELSDKLHDKLDDMDKLIHETLVLRAAAKT